ncbi:serine esterase [Cyclospora cayetanensis]|uniref:Serine esterase n=1 Tax=Cyclospora cayetanensis TaxID=88456 RepID=A0A1D3CZ53_9EIME|nr:serine esterase [Cyclospora cayetanensis]
MLCASYQNVACLASTANTDDTEGDIAVMGERLADEVLTYVKSFFGNSGVERISFVGHSLGGIIVRAALPHLRKPLGSCFHLYVSLSSPHFGLLKGRSRIVSFGLWLLKKWRKSLCLQQLTLSDSRDLRQCYLYRLSRCDALSLFEHLCFLASAQDAYAPLHSAAMLPLHQQDVDTAAGAAAAQPPPICVLSPRGVHTESSSDCREAVESRWNPSSPVASPSLEEALGAVRNVLDGERSARAFPDTLPADRQQPSPIDASSESETPSVAWTDEVLEEHADTPQSSLHEGVSDSEDALPQHQAARHSHILASLSRNIAAWLPPEKVMRINVIFKIREK